MSMLTKQAYELRNIAAHLADGVREGGLYIPPELCLIWFAVVRDAADTVLSLRERCHELQRESEYMSGEERLSALGYSRSYQSETGASEWWMKELEVSGIPTE